MKKPLDIQILPRHLSVPGSDPTGIDNQTVIVNGIVDPLSICYFLNNLANINVYLRSETVFEELLQYSYEELGAKISEIRYTIDPGGKTYGISTIFRFENYESEEHAGVAPLLRMLFSFSPEKWDRPYSIQKLSDVFLQVIQTENFGGLAYNVGSETEILSGCGLSFEVRKATATLQEELNELLPKFRAIISKTEKLCISALDMEGLTVFFTFPEEIKTACKQYLIYFAQFLLDLGIEAETEIKEENGNTLFKVIPADQTEALDRIKEALQTYLDAPGAAGFEMEAAASSNLSVMQWQANVMHLKSQLMLANSVLQMNDATIESLRLSNYQYKTLLAKYDASGEEDLIKGVVAVKKYEGKGFSVNLPEIFRRLKRRFKK